MNTLLEAFIAHYSVQYEIAYNTEIAGEIPAVYAKNFTRESKSVLGVAAPKMGLGPEAGEYVFFFNGELFDEAAFRRIELFLKNAEKELVKPSPDHAFTFLSAVVIVTGDVEKPALDLLRRYRQQNNYPRGGWSLARFAVVRPPDLLYSNKSGSDLKKLLQRVIKNGV